MAEADDTHSGIVAAMKSYVAETLHAHLDLRPWSEACNVPGYLSNAYLMLHGDLGGRRTLWLLARDEPTPAAVDKHLAVLDEFWPDAKVVVFGRLSSYVRQRLIERGISFIVPGTQLYLPQHGLDFRSRSKQPAQLTDALRPSSQATLLYLLLCSEDGGRAQSASELAPILVQSLMTASRAVAELEAHRLVITQKVGRTKEVRLRGGAREVWEAAQDLLRTPVLRRLTLLDDPSIVAEDRFLAGLSALSRQTMLAEPRTRTYAVNRGLGKELEAGGTVIARNAPSLADEVGSWTIEVWSYDPAPPAVDGVVDPLSLFLSLRDDPDERVQAALRLMVDGLPWATQ